LLLEIIQEFFGVPLDSLFLGFLGDLFEFLLRFEPFGGVVAL
jgi:hypothetical protein